MLQRVAACHHRHGHAHPARYRRQHMARPLQHRLRPRHSGKARIDLRFQVQPLRLQIQPLRSAQQPRSRASAQPLHIQPKRPRRRHTSRRSMRLLQQSLVGQLRHLIAHRRRTQPRRPMSARPHPRNRPRNRPRAHRLAGLDVALHDGRQDRPLPRRYPLRLRHRALPHPQFIPSVNPWFSFSLLLRTLPHPARAHPTWRGPLLLPHLVHQLLRNVFGGHIVRSRLDPPPQRRHLLESHIASPARLRDQHPGQAHLRLIVRNLPGPAAQRLWLGSARARLSQPRPGRRRQATGRFNRGYMRKVRTQPNSTRITHPRTSTSPYLSGSSAAAAKTSDRIPVLQHQFPRIARKTASKIKIISQSAPRNRNGNCLHQSVPKNPS